MKGGICPIASPKRPNCSYNVANNKGIVHIFHCACARRVYSKSDVIIVFLDHDFL